MTNSLHAAYADSPQVLMHDAVYPSFAFQFDTDHGSITFSGATRRSENLIELAAETDILVHEAIRTVPRSPSPPVGPGVDRYLQVPAGLSRPRPDPDRR